MVSVRGLNSLVTTVSSGESIRWFPVVFILFLLRASPIKHPSDHHAAIIDNLAVIIQDAPWDLRLVQFGCSFEVSFLTATGRTAGIVVIWRIFLRNIASFFRLLCRLPVQRKDPACRPFSILLACRANNPILLSHIQPVLLHFALRTGQFTIIILRWWQHL